MIVLHLKNISIIFLLISIVSLTSVSCSDSGKGSKKKGPPRTLTVKALIVKKSALKAKQVFSGTIEALRTVKVYNQEEGLILTLPVLEGDSVEQGQVIATLDSNLLQAELNKATITHRQAALDLKRLKRLRKKRLASDAALAQAQTTLELALSEKNILSIRFERTQVKAPITGVISERLIEKGSVASKFSPIVTISDVSKLKVKVSISELLLPSIQLGDEVQVQISALGSQTFSAQISLIYPTIDRTSRQGTIEILLNEPPVAAKPGQLTRVQINTQTNLNLNVPLLAIKHNYSGAYVFKIVDNKAVITTVTTGRQLSNQIEILTGLNEGDTIVTQGFLGLTNNKAVTVNNASALLP